MIKTDKDASGWQKFSYGKLGEVTKNIRTFALPLEEHPYTFVMEYEYDSWKICASRMKRKLVFFSEAQPNLREANFSIQSMTYPDGEVVTYDYNLSGMLKSMAGEKNNVTYPYIKKIEYNEFELKKAVWYGNGTIILPKIRTAS